MFYRILITLFLIPALAFSYTVVRKDGKVFSGKLVVETSAEITLKDQEGVTIKFKKEQIDWDKTTIERQKEDENDRVLNLSRPLQGVVEVRRVEEERQKWTGESISIDFKDIDIRDLFRFLAETGDLNLVVDPGVKGTVTIKMTDVPWDQVLDVLCKMHGLGYTIDGNVVSINK